MREPRNHRTPPKSHQSHQKTRLLIRMISGDHNTQRDIHVTRKSAACLQGSRVPMDLEAFLKATYT